MDQLVLWAAVPGVALGLIWIGTSPRSMLTRVLIRPAALAALAMLILVKTAGNSSKFPYLMVCVAALLGIWEGYAGAYQMLGSRDVKRSPHGQVKVCAVWLGNVLANLVLLTMASSLAYPGAFIRVGQTASLLDVAYLTLLTFASAGYGDVVPGSAVGQILMILTSLAGLTYATILFAALFDALRGE